MKPIPNQPYVFEKFPTEDACKGIHETSTCVIQKTSDVIYLQFERDESEESIICPLIDQSLIAELIYNGDFSNNDDGWTPFLSGWTISGGKATHTGGSSGNLEAPALIVFNKLYKVKFSVSGLVPGASVTPYIGGVGPGNNGLTITDDGDYEMPIVNTVSFSQLLTFVANGDLSIDNVSLTPWIGDNGCLEWAESQFDYTANGLVRLPLSSAPSDIVFSDPLVVGKHYRLKIEINTADGGYALIKNGSNVVANVRIERQDYYFEALSTSLLIEVSPEFNSIFKTIELYEVEYFGSEFVYLESMEEIPTVFDLQPKVFYHERWATVIFNPAEMEIPEGCYRFVYLFSSGGSPVAFTSNCISIKNVVDDCMKQVRGRCDCEGYGFNFKNFLLQMWVPMRFLFPPSYPKTDVVDTDSSGTVKRIYASRGKKWTVKTDDMDEAAHDCMSLMVQCDYLQIDNLYYISQDREYSVDGDRNSEQLKAPASFDIETVQSVVYNRNSGCNTGLYLLRVLYGWDIYTSYKQLDKFNVGAGYTMTIAINRIIVNAQDLIQAPVYLTFYNNPSTGITPSIIIAEGINGNLNYVMGTNWPQNVDIELNKLIKGGEVRFYDNLTVIEILEGTSFQIDISIKPYNIGPWVRRRYTETGLIWPDIDPYWVYLTYVP